MINQLTNSKALLNDTVTGKYYSGLDGLRGIAIILVVGYHYFPFLSLFNLGWLGVDLFFVLSGFLITEILLRTNNTENQLRNFYIRRILRIFPAYYLTLFLYFFILPGLGSAPGSQSYYATNKAWFLLYLQNWLFILKTPDPSTFLNHYWSLAIEEQFYIIWPLLMLLIRNTKKLTWILLSVLILLGSIRIILFAFPLPKLNYYNFHTFSRIDGLVAGSLLAIYLQTIPVIPRKLILQIIAGLLLLNGTFFLADASLQLHLPYFPFLGYTSFSIAFALLVYLIISRQDNLRFFSHRLLRFPGNISYGLYLYHWPIYLIAFPKFQSICRLTLNLSTVVSDVIAAAFCTITAIVISFLSYRFIESKFLAFKKYAIYQPGKKEVLTARS